MDATAPQPDNLRRLRPRAAKLVRAARDREHELLAERALALEAHARLMFRLDAHLKACRAVIDGIEEGSGDDAETIIDNLVDLGLVVLAPRPEERRRGGQ